MKPPDDCPYCHTPQPTVGPGIHARGCAKDPEWNLTWDGPMLKPAELPHGEPVSIELAREIERGWETRNHEHECRREQMKAKAHAAGKMNH
jgi:hypothetical protein